MGPRESSSTTFLLIRPWSQLAALRSAKPGKGSIVLWGWSGKMVESFRNEVFEEVAFMRRRGRGAGVIVSQGEARGDGGVGRG